MGIKISQLPVGEAEQNAVVPATNAAGNTTRKVTMGEIASLATKQTVGLGNVDNTSDANKPISTAVQNALDAKLSAPSSPNTNDVILWNGSSWVSAPGGAGGETAFAIGSSGSAKTINLANGTIQTCTLTNNCTFTMPSALPGKSFTLFVTQGNSAYDATFTGAKWPGGSPPIISATTGAVDLITFVSDGAYWYGTFVQNFF